MITDLRPTKTVDSALTPCDGRSAVFDSTDAEMHKVAKAICDGCPFFVGCDRLRKATERDYTATFMEGTWAGKLYRRRKTKAERVEEREMQPCGTLAAYRRHLRRGEEPCEPCRAVNNARNEKYRNGRAYVECAECGQERRHAGRGLCESCRRVFKLAGTLDELYPTRNVFDGAA